MVTVKVVVATFQMHDELLPQETVAVEPSGSIIGIRPKTFPFIFSLNVTEKASPTSLKSVLALLLTTRVSVRVGGVKSGAPVLNVVLEGFGRLFNDLSLISPGAGKRVTVNVVLPASGALRSTAKVLRAVICVVPHGSLKSIATTSGSDVAELLSVRTMWPTKNAVHQTGSEKVSVTLVDPTSPAAMTRVGVTVSGGLAVAV